MTGAEAALRIGQLLPDGVATPGTLLRVALDDGVEVGWIWVSLPGPGPVRARPGSTTSRCIRRTGDADTDGG
ncbi:hypothetical protein [Micromonospora sp. NPDC048830]|uniref:hypothetical protein n=1 Tax=Micromonospora sp. NPDC048830 TaxID=3364257 RepID=UPI0037136D38